MNTQDLQSFFPGDFSMQLLFNPLGDTYLNSVIKSIFNHKEITEDEINNLKIFVDLRLEYEKKRVSLDEAHEIKNYISFFSLAHKSPYEKTPLEKTSFIFENIENIFFIITEQSKNKAEEFKRDLKKSFPNKNIELISMNENEDAHDYEDVYKNLRDIFDKYNLHTEETLIDNTLGFKMTSAVFYRFCVEQGVKLISWQNKQITPIENGFAVRVPGTDSLHFLRYPQFENYSLLCDINTLISEFKFKEASYLCKAINNNEKANLLKILSTWINIETFSNEEVFFSNIEIFSENCNSLKIADPKLKDSINKISQFFKSLTSLKDKKERRNNYIFFTTVFIYFNIFYSNSREVFLKTLLSKYLTKESIFSIFKELDELKKEISNIDISENENNESYNFFSDFSSVLEEHITDFSIDYSESDFAIFDFMKNLEYTLPKQVSFEKGILFLNKFNLKVDFNTHEVLKKYITKNNNNNLLKKLFSSKEYSFNHNQFKEIFFLYKKDSNARLPRPIHTKGSTIKYEKLKKEETLPTPEAVNTNFNRLEKHINILNQELETIFKNNKISISSKFIKLDNTDYKKGFNEYIDSCKIEISSDYI